jgi:hypothetical protein
MNGPYRKKISIDKSKTSLIDSNNEYYGSSKALNIACNLALELNIDIVIIVDDDMIVPEKDWVSDFITPYFENKNVAMTGINALINKSDLTNQWYMDCNNESFDYLDTPFSMKLDDYCDLGFWDEDYNTGCGNNDYCLRVWASDKIIYKINNNHVIQHFSHSTHENPNKPDSLKRLIELTPSDNEIFLQKHGNDWRKKYKRDHIKELGLPMYFRDSGINEIYHRLLVYGVDVYSASSIANSVSNYPITGPSSKISSVDDLDLSNVLKMRIQYNKVE